MFNQNPYIYNMPNMGNVYGMGGLGTNIGLSRGLGGLGQSLGASAGIGRGVSGLLRGFSWGGMLDGVQKTLNVVNQALPIYNQVKPMFRNIGTMFKVMGELNRINSNEKTDTKVESTSNTSNPSFFA